MFFARRPSAAVIERFLRESQHLPLSYAAPGLVRQPSSARGVDEQVVPIGRGLIDFARAQDALAAWRQFDLGWVELFPASAAIAPGTTVAVLIRHLGFWSLNGCRVVYNVEAAEDEARFGFAYGTLTNHAESGEELFEVFLDRRTEDVMYRIRARSWPQASLAWLGQPVVRALQERFRRDSAATMAAAVRGAGAPARGDNELL